jgi:hypothetical protein
VGWILEIKEMSYGIRVRGWVGKGKGWSDGW